MVQQPLPESLRVLALVKEYAMGTNAGGAEVVRHRADRHDQVVVGNSLSSQQFDAAVVLHMCNHDLAARPVDVLQGAKEEPEAPAMTVRPVPDFVETCARACPR